MKSTGRLNKELTDLNTNNIEGVSIEIVGDQLTNWVAHIQGPVSLLVLTLPAD